MEDYQKEVFDKRIVWLVGLIEPERARETIERLVVLDIRCHDDITLVINSTGGCCSSSFAVYDTMKSVNSSITTVGIGRVASAALYLLAGGARNKRYIATNGILMMHQVSQSLVEETVSDLSITIAELARINEQAVHLLALESGKSVEQIREDAQRDYYMTAQQAIDYGFADKILPPNFHGFRGSK